MRRVELVIGRRHLDLPIKFDYSNSDVVQKFQSAKS